MDTFHIPEQRVNKINEPLLVIGLGGTGTDALLNVMDKFKRRFNLPMVEGEMQDVPARTAYLSIDTDTTVLTQKKCNDTVLNVNEFLDLSLPNMAALLDPRRSRSLLKNYELSWLDRDLQSLNAAFGAGGVRQCGRLMLCKKTEQIVRKLGTLIHALMEVVSGEDDRQTLTVVLLAGLGGGTGSGIFLDMAYLIRYVMGEQFRGIHLSLMGFFVLPDVNMSHANLSEAHRKVLRTNAFAALKELDFWMGYDTHHYAYTHKYTEGVEVTWTQPFNDVVLLGEKNEDGVIIRNAYDVVMDTISETLMHFMAEERNRTNDGFTYQSHRVNVQGAMAHLSRTYPVQYNYMAIGAASTESQQNSMVAYEAKLTLDTLMTLQKNDDLLKTFFPDTFLRAVLPETEDAYMLFDAVCPLPACFHQEPGFEFDTIRMMRGDAALHMSPMAAYLRGASIAVQPFAKEYLQRLWGRFRDRSIETIRNPQQGPFRFEQYLKDAEQGMVARLEKWVQFWQNEADNLRAVIAAQRSQTENTLYPDLVNVPVLEWLLTKHKASKYVDEVAVLYTNARNQIVAETLLVVFQTLYERVRNYTRLNLTSFNRMLGNLQRELTESVGRMNSAVRTNDTQLISFDHLKEYVDAEFSKLKGGLNETTAQVLARMAEMSFALEIDSSSGSVAELDVKQQEFVALVSQFVGETFRSVNRVRLDGVLDMTMPAASETERINYVATTLLPRLRNSARTMYQTHPAMQGVANSYIDYSYVSVPFDADIMKKGLEKYRSAGEPITPKESEITDRLYWLRTYNCLPLCRFAMLSTLEADYEESLTKPGVLGLHLLYNIEDTGARERVRGNWKMLPSPVPHLLLGEPLSRRQQAFEAHRIEITRKAFTLGVMRLPTDATPDGVDIYLKREPNGCLMENDTFCNLVDGVMHDTELTYAEKRTQLKALCEGLQPEVIRYDNYVDEFAKCLKLSVQPTVNTDAVRVETAKNREETRRYIAGYMVALKPLLFEQMESQLNMFDRYQAAVDEIAAREEEFQRLLQYATRFSLMLFLNLIRRGFGAFQFDMSSRPDDVLFSFDQVRPEESATPLILVLLSVLANPQEQRIEPMKRRYLEQTATQRIEKLDRSTPQEQEDFKKNAQTFLDTYGEIPEQLRYNRTLNVQQREWQTMLLNQMLSTARQYLHF